MRFGCWTLVVAFVAGLGGCTPAWRPPAETVKIAEARQRVDLADYAPASREVARTFTRLELESSPTDTTEYRRRYSGRWRVEGVMANSPAGSLSDYLGENAPRSADRWRLWPVGPNRKGAAFFLEFEPPLVYLPASIEADRRVSQTVALRYFNRDGIPRRRGSVKRTIELEGFETVIANGTSHADCIRLKMETHIRVNWGPRVDLTEYIWLAGGIGEVRRIQRFGGMAYLVPFSEVQTFELASGSPDDAPAGGERAEAGELWARCAVYLDRLPPHPRLGGLTVELVPGRPALASSPPDTPWHD